MGILADLFLKSLNDPVYQGLPYQSEAFQDLLLGCISFWSHLNNSSSGSELTSVPSVSQYPATNSFNYSFYFKYPQESLQLSCILKLFQFLFLLGLRLQSYMGFKLSAPTQFFPKPVFVCNQGEVFQECK